MIQGQSFESVVEQRNERSRCRKWTNAIAVLECKVDAPSHILVSKRSNYTGARFLTKRSYTISQAVWEAKKEAILTR